MITLNTMKKYVFTYLFIAFAFGNYCSEQLNTATNLRFYFFSILLLLIFSTLIKGLRYKNILFSTLFSLLGFIHHQQFNNHVSQLDVFNKKTKIYRLEIINSLKHSPKNSKYIAKETQTQERILLHIPREAPTFNARDVLLISGRLQTPQTALNPYQFNYADYLKQQRVHYQIFASSFYIKVAEGKGWRNWASRSKEHLQQRLKNQGYSIETRGIISSMVLGDRSELTNEVYDTYKKTGIIHILAISGLHVMIIFGIVYFLLSPIRLFRHGRLLQLAMSLLILWLFTFYVEMVPSVFRATIMLTVYYIGDFIKRPRNVFHSLSLSGLILLLINPNFLFAPGFLLSFSAVFFIVWLNPLFNPNLKFKSKLIKAIYEIGSTSVAAQLGTMPVSIYYFNQVSGLFLAGNLIIIPSAFFMLSGALLSTVLAWLSVNINPWITLFNNFINLINTYIKWLSHFDGLIFKQLSISFLSSILLFFMVYLIRPIILNRSVIALFSFLGIFIIFRFNNHLEVRSKSTTSELIIFNVYKTSLIGIRNGQELTLFSSHPLDSIPNIPYTIEPYQIGNRIKKTDFYSLNDTLYTNSFIKTKSLLITPAFRLFIGENYPSHMNNITHLLARNSAMDTSLIENFPQKIRVIADASNYPLYNQRLDSLVQSYAINPVWITAKEGAFIVSF